MLPNIPTTDPSLLAKQAMQATMAAKNEAELRAAAVATMNQNIVRLNMNNMIR